MTAELATVTVTYNPEMTVLLSQMAQLPPTSTKILVDNGSTVELREELRRLCAVRSDVHLVENSGNLGLAAALNQGARAAAVEAPECRYLLFLDQDTEPQPGSVERLFAAYQTLAKSDARLGCVGPALEDVGTGLRHGFHQMRTLAWIRRYPAAGSTMPLPVTNLNGSGTLMSVALFNELGGWCEPLFIDHVDTEWSFRVLASGRTLYGIPVSTFAQRMGARSLRFWMFGWRVWPYRAPERHFYLFRNTVRLLRMGHVPLTWKLLAPVKLAITLVAHLAFDPARTSQAKQMASGVRAGLRKAASPVH